MRRQLDVKAAAAKAMYQSRLGMLARAAFEWVYPGEVLIENWHIGVVCHALTRVLRGSPQQLIVNLPPRNLKSFLASVLFPIFAILHQPHLRIMVLAGTIDLRAELVKNVLAVLSSERFRSIADMAYERQGFELRFWSGGSILFGVYGQSRIGRGFDLCIIDDPQPPERTRTARQRAETNDYFDRSVRPRMNRSGSGRIVVVQQRLHEDDLSGHLEQQGGWEVLAIPAIAYHLEQWSSEGGIPVWRRAGDPICPERESRAELRARLYEVGGVVFSAQYQQTPYSGDNPSEVRGQIVYTLPGPEDDPQTFQWTLIFARIAEAVWVDERVFGTRLSYTRQRPELTLEEWERLAVAQQRALVERVRREREDEERKREH